jgi:hypothetical protein
VEHALVRAVPGAVARAPGAGNRGKAGAREALPRTLHAEARTEREGRPNGCEAGGEAKTEGAARSGLSPRVDGVIDVVAADVTLPEWWNFHTCRSGSIHMFSEAAGPILCTDFMGSCSSGGGISAILPGVPGVNAERIEFSRLKCVPFGGAPPSDLVAGIEYVGPVLVINFTRTVGSPSCAGCGTGVCLLLTQLQVVGSGGTVTLTAPLVPPDGNVATWQGVGFTPGGVCLAATPARQPTWGAVKSLYR